MSQMFNGAAQGAAAGSAFGPWGTAIGAGLGAVGGIMGSSSKKKAAKMRMKMLQEGLKQFKAGSLDALGNKLSADDKGLWSYNLSRSGNAAKSAANKGIYELANYNNKSRAEILRDNLAGNHLADTLTARANQAAAMRSGARTNSNLGAISTAYARQGSQNLRNNYLNAMKNAKNSASYNANVRNNLAQAAQSAMYPINSIQGNLQNMVNSLNRSVMNQYNAMAGAAANPYYNGQSNADNVSILGDLLSSLSNQNIDIAENKKKTSTIDQILALLNS